MQYLLLIYGDETLEATITEEEDAARNAGYGQFMHEMGEERGLLRGGERLHPSGDSTVIRVREGDLHTSDGPFAETKEQIAGYYLIEAPDQAAALAWASRCPATGYGAVEVREVV